MSDRNRIPLNDLLRLAGSLAASQSSGGDWIDNLAKLPGMSPYGAALRSVFGRRQPEQSSASSSAGRSAPGAATTAEVPVGGETAEKWWDADTVQQAAEQMGLPPAVVERMMAEGTLSLNGGSAKKPSKAAKMQDQLTSVTAAQGAASVPQPVPQEDRAAAPSRASTGADAGQAALDAVGVADPTGIADGVNAAWSVGRIFTDPKRWKEHATNAAISAVSVIPYVGDTAKLLKGRRYARTAKRIAGIGRRVSGAEPEAGGSGGGDLPPIAPPAAGRDDEPGRGPRQSRVEAEGIRSYDSWTQKLADGAKQVAGFTVKVAAAVEGLKLLNAGVLALNRDLAPYNGNLAGAYARYDADQLQRDVRKGEALSGPLSKLAEEQSELKDTLDSISNPLQAIGIELLGTVTQGVNTVLEVTQILRPAIWMLEQIVEWLPGAGKAGDDTPWRQFFDDVSDGKFDGNRPDFHTGSPVNLWPSEKERREIFG